MEEIRKRVHVEVRDWKRKFDAYIEELLSNEYGLPESIVDFAAKLADARHRKLQEVFGEDYAKDD